MTLSQENGITIGRYTLDRYYRREFKFLPHTVMEKGSSWRYSNTYSESWNTAEFDDASWTSGSYFPVIGEDVITRYYRTSISFDDLTGFASFELAVNTNYGIAMYVNGVEIYRHNLAEDANSTTPATAEESSAFFHRAFANRHLLDSTAVFAVEIHFPSGHSSIVDPFDAFVNLVYGNTHRSFDGSVSGTHQSDYWDELAPNLWDNQLCNKWYVNGFPAENIYTFNSERAEYVNMYAVTSGNQDTGRRPTQWKLDASNDGENWDLLDAQIGVTWNGYGETKYFPIPQTVSGYKMYKWTLQASSTSESEVSDMALYAVDMDIAPKNISYGETHYFYPDQSITVTPEAKGFYSWSISPELPSGLNFNSVTGVVSGTVPSGVSLGPQTYTVTASRYDMEGTIQGTLSIVYDTCLGSGYRRVQIAAVKGHRRASQGYDIVRNGEIVKSVHMNDVFGYFTDDDTSSTSQTDVFCLPEDVYQLVFHADHGIGKWTEGSSVTLTTYSNSGTSFFIGKYSGMADGSTASFSNKYLLDGEMNAWTYLADGTVPAGWNSVDFSSWSELTSGISVSHSVWLFRTTVVVDSLEGVNSYELNMNCRAGVVVYLNGVEVYRIGYEGEGVPSATSTISSSSSSAHVFVGLAGNDYLKEGSNVFAVAVINSDSSDTEIDFTATLTLRGATAIMSHGTGISSSASSGTASTCFNGETNNKWSATLDEDTYIQYTWTNSQYRRQQVNKVCLVSASDAPGNEPSDFILSTTLDDEIWTPVANYSGVYWSERSQRQCFYLEDPVAIRGMRVQVNAVAASESTTVELSIFDFLLENLDNADIPELAYSGSLKGVVGALVEPAVPTSSYYASFSSDPSLPSGLQFGSNGAIYGQPLESASGVYTITGISVNGTTSITTIEINIVECIDNEILGYIHITDTGSHGRYMGYDLIDPSNDEVIASRSDFPNNAVYIYHAYCFGLKSYRIVFNDYARVAWPGDVEVLTSSHLVMSTFTVAASTQPNTQSFFPRLGFSSDLEWRYLMNNEDPVSNWYTNEFSGEWSSSTIAELPPSPYTAAYYCTNFNLYTADGYATMDVITTTRGGFILYVNGEEKARYNLPDTGVTHTTQPTIEAEEPSDIRISVDMTAGAIAMGAGNFRVKSFAIPLRCSRSSTGWAFLSCFGSAHS